MRLGIEKIVGDFRQEKRVLRERREKKLEQIAWERAKLAELEQSALAEMSKDLSTCEKSVGAEVQRTMKEAEKTFRVDKSFEDMK